MEALAYYQAKVTSDGYRIVVPKATRDKYGIQIGDYVTVRIEKGAKAVFTSKVSTKGLVSIPQRVIEALDIKPREILDVAILEFYHPKGGRE
jgi:bifunctional DNA-binding transcriptional regulator/antitoxin component of YhaV-PrlF toxin-antitoxin module